MLEEIYDIIPAYLTRDQSIYRVSLVGTIFFPVMRRPENPWLETTPDRKLIVRTRVAELFWLWSE